MVSAGLSEGLSEGDGVAKFNVGSGLAVGNVPPDVGVAVGSGAIPLPLPLAVADGATVGDFVGSVVSDGDAVGELVGDSVGLDVF